MTADAMLSIACYGSVALVVIAFLHVTSQRERLLTPILLFVGIEITVVWLPLLPSGSGVLGDGDPFPSILAAISLLAAVVFYTLFGGNSVDATKWRTDGDSPPREEIRSLGVGIVLLVGLLSALGLYRFGGVPPMLTGGLTSLLDPVGSAEQTTLIRETRRSLTKGQLIGADSSGQGLFNTIAEIGWQVALAASVLYWTYVRSRRSVQTLAVVACLAFVFLGSAGARAPLLFCAISGAAILVLRYRLGVRQIVMAGFCAIGLALLIMPLAKGATAGVSIGDRSMALIERVSSGNGANNAQIVRLVGAGTLDIKPGDLFVERAIALVPGASPTDPFALRITRLVKGPSLDTTGYSTPTQYGLLYADGGPLGVVVGYCLSGVLLAVGWRWLLRIPSSAGALGAAQGSVLLGYVAVTGVHGIVANGLVAVLLILTVSGPYAWSRMHYAWTDPDKKVLSA